MGALMALALVAGACSTLALEGGTSERAQLQRNRERWERQQLASYRYSYAKECFCAMADAIEIEVRNRVVVAAFPSGSGESVPEYALDQLPTVDSLFAIVDRAIAGRVDLLEVEYHPILGYPTRIAVDQAFNTADEGVVHIASALTPIIEP